MINPTPVIRTAASRWRKHRGASCPLRYDLHRGSAHCSGLGGVARVFLPISPAAPCCVHRDATPSQCLLTGPAKAKNGSQLSSSKRLRMGCWKRVLLLWLQDPYFERYSSGCCRPRRPKILVSWCRSFRTLAACGSWGSCLAALDTRLRPNDARPDRGRGRRGDSLRVGNEPNQTNKSHLILVILSDPPPFSSSSSLGACHSFVPIWVTCEVPGLVTIYTYPLPLLFIRLCVLTQPAFSQWQPLPWTTKRPQASRRKTRARSSSSLQTLRARAGSPSLTKRMRSLGRDAIWRVGPVACYYLSLWLCLLGI